MLSLNEDLEDALTRYLRLLDEKEYFEAHEVLEEAWHPLRLRNDPLANLVKGLINASICFEHIKRDKKNAQKKAKKVLASFERHKHLYTKNIKHEALFASAIHKIENLKSHLSFL
jgi:predicted metal-dependent hydrolase